MVDPQHARASGDGAGTLPDLLSQMLLAAVSGTTEEESDERFNRSTRSVMLTVYIRQSSMQQVRTRLEGQRHRYDLRERAHALGFQRITVIDEDLGRSGTGSVERRPARSWGMIVTS